MSSDKLTQEIDRLYRNARELRECGKFTEATALFRILVDINPDEPFFNWELGYALLDADLPQLSISYFEKAIALNPDCYPAWGGLGHAYTKLFEFERAEAAFRKRLEIKESTNHYVFLALALYMRKQYADSIQCCENAITLDPMHEEAYFNLAMSLKRLGQVEASMAALQKAISLKPDYALALSELAYLCLLRGDMDQSRILINSSKEKNAKIPTTFLYEFLLLQELHMMEDAEDVLDTLRNFL